LTHVDDGKFDQAIPGLLLIVLNVIKPNDSCEDDRKISRVEVHFTRDIQMNES